MDNNVMEKIRHLFAMAEHANSNENEAAIALEKAQELLLRHNLTRGDINNNDNNNTPVGIGKIDGSETSGYNWKSILLNTIAKNNLCRVIGTSRLKQWHLFGTYENVKAVLQMYHYIVPELEHIALIEWNKYKKSGGYENARSWKNGFFFGAINTINKRLSETMERFVAGDSRAIINYNQGMVNDAIHKVYPHVVNRRTSIRSTSGYGQGQSAGNNIHLKPQGKLNGVLALNRG